MDTDTDILYDKVEELRRSLSDTHTIATACTVCHGDGGQIEAMVPCPACGAAGTREAQLARLSKRLDKIEAALACIEHVVLGAAQ